MSNVIDLAAFGLEPRPADASVFTALTPWSFPTPTRCLAWGAGAVGMHRVHVIAYEHLVFRTTKDDRMVQEPEVAIVVVAENAAIVGNARVAVDHKTFRLFGLIEIGGMKDQRVGDRAFDDRFYIHAEDDAAARRAISEPLRAHMLRAAIGGELELRDGLLLYRAQPDLGTRSLENALADVHGILDAIAPPGGYR